MLRIYSNGITAGLPPKTVSQHERVKRSDCSGWSETATRNNTAFLYSVNSTELNGYGYAFTFTVKDLPDSPDDWHRLRDVFLKRCRRAGMIRYHWVTEWQKRGVPHLHGCIYFPDPLSWNEVQQLSKAWCDVAKPYGSLYKGQQIKPIESSLGWLKYLAKHGSRSSYHYQRSSKPVEWDSTGRVWGKGGDWPTRETVVDLTIEQFHQFRRLAKSWRKADARTPLKIVDADGKTLNPDFLGIPYDKLPRNGRRITQARKMFNRGDKDISRLIGVSEWIPEAIAFRMIESVMNRPQTTERGPLWGERLPVSVGE